MHSCAEEQRTNFTTHERFYMSRMKPLPKAILIAAVVGGLGYGANLFLNKAGGAETVLAQAATATSTVSAPSGSSLKRILDTGVIRASVQSPAAPFFSSLNGVATGFNVEFVSLLTSQAEFAKGGKRIVLEPMTVDTYPDVPKQLATNAAVDIAIDGLTFPDNEPSGIVYSVPYIEDFGYALIGTKALMVRSPEDVNDLTVGVLAGDPDAKGFITRQFPRAKIVELSDASTNGQRTWISDALKSGKVDGVVYDYPFAVAEIAGTDLQFAVSKLPGSNIKYRIGVRKGDADLLEAINASIRKVKADPAYADLIRKYFTAANTVAVKAASKTETIYTVKPGDTLSTIAASQLGDRMRYTEIEARNNLANPNLIQVGQKLVITKS